MPIVTPRTVAASMRPDRSRWTHAAPRRTALVRGTFGKPSMAQGPSDFPETPPCRSSVTSKGFPPTTSTVASHRNGTRHTGRSPPTRQPQARWTVRCPGTGICCVEGRSWPDGSLRDTPGPGSGGTAHAALYGHVVARNPIPELLYGNTTGCCSARTSRMEQHSDTRRSHCPPRQLVRRSSVRPPCPWRAPAPDTRRRRRSARTRRPGR